MPERSRRKVTGPDKVTTTRYRRRDAPWAVTQHESELLPALRALYLKYEAEGGNWFGIAQRSQQNRSTVQRLLACTNVQRPNNGRHLAAFEAVAKAMGYRCVLVPIDPPPTANPKE